MFGSSFRLGLPGFLTSAELRSAGYKPNNQLRDQRVAFDWLRRNIAGFGGAGEELTVAGESAGAGSENPTHPLSSEQWDGETDVE